MTYPDRRANQAYLTWTILDYILHSSLTTTKIVLLIIRQMSSARRQLSRHERPRFECMVAVNHRNPNIQACDRFPPANPDQKDPYHPLQSEGSNKCLMPSDMNSKSRVRPFKTRS